MTAERNDPETAHAVPSAPFDDPASMASPHLDALAILAAHTLGASSAVVSLCAEAGQVLVGRCGVGPAETPHALAWCDHTLHHGGVLVVADAAAEHRFASGARGSVQGPFRSCLGAVLTRPGSRPFGTLCTLGSAPRTPTDEERADLTRFASLVVDHLDGLVRSRELEEAHHAAAQQRQRLAAQAVHVERLASLGLLATGLAHEVNSPLASLRLNLESLRSELAEVRPYLPGPQNAELSALLTELNAGADRIAQLVSGLQHHTRPDGPPPAPVAVRSLVERAQRLSGVHRQPGASVRILVSDRLQVVGRATQLVQVFFNLLLNARQACADASQPCSVEVQGSPTEHGVHVTVRDNGPGMAPALLARATEPFFTTRPDGGGTGLGLYVCEAIVKAHGGDLRLESSPGAGTVVHVVLPAADPTA